MTPTQKLKWLVLAAIATWEKRPVPAYPCENIDELYDLASDTTDAKDALRVGQYLTSLPCPFSRHYESKSVAAQMPDGSWVGWTYWYGGGKHGEPEAIDWMGDAYDVNCVEEQKLVTVRTFSKNV